MFSTRQLSQEYERLFASTPWVLGAGIGTFLIVLSYAVNQIAGKYATAVAVTGHSISDAFLDLVPRVDTSLVHTNTPTILTLFMLATLFFLPRYLPMAFNGIALLILARSVFINMTHLGMYRDAILIDSGTTFGGDLFFSGHVAIPFMLALVFWREKTLRVFFFALSFVLGAESLVGHFHYSIDVFAAPFIAYGIYAFLVKAAPSLVNP